MRRERRPGEEGEYQARRAQAFLDDVWVYVVHAGRYGGFWVARHHEQSTGPIVGGAIVKGYTLEEARAALFAWAKTNGRVLRQMEREHRDDDSVIEIWV